MNGHKLDNPSAREGQVASSQARIEGALTVDTVENLRTRLLDFARSATDNILDLSAVDLCDTAGLQLLCAARKSALAAGKKWQLSPLPPAILEGCQKMGLDPVEISEPLIKQRL